jgi:hypothetical protein
MFGSDVVSPNTSTGIIDSGLALRAPRNDKGRIPGDRLHTTATDTLPHSRDLPRPSFAINIRPESKGAGNTGCQMHPWFRAKCRGGGGSATGSPASHRHSLHNGFTAYFVLSRATGLSCHPRLRGVSGPLEPTSPTANLTPASGRQDHTTSPYATASLVRAPKTHDDAKASTASRTQRS